MTTYYSRLNSLEDKRRTRKAVGLLFLAGVVVGLSIFAGQKALTELFLFISSIKSSGQTNTNDDFIPPGPPQIFLPYEATNSATITLTGYAEPDAKVFVTLNSDPLNDSRTGDDGSFKIDNVELTEGNNIFAAVAVDGAGNKSQVSNQESIFYSNKPPKLEILSPVNNKNLSGTDNFVLVNGNSDPLVKITVNDRQVIVSSGGSFTYRMALNPGENVITIKAVDQAGNNNQADLKVNYSP